MREITTACIFYILYKMVFPYDMTHWKNTGDAPLSTPQLLNCDVDGRSASFSLTRIRNEGEVDGKEGGREMLYAPTPTSTHTHTHTHTHSDLHPCTVRALKIDKEQLDRESKLARRVSVQSYSHTHDTYTLHWGTFLTL